jgi:hypothetical protein
VLAGLLLGCNLPAALRPHVLITQAKHHPVRKNIECFCSRGLSLYTAFILFRSGKKWVRVHAVAVRLVGWPAVRRISLFCRKYIRFQFSTAAAIENGLGRGGVSNSRECESSVFALLFGTDTSSAYYYIAPCEANFYCRTAYALVQTLHARKEYFVAREKCSLDTLNVFSPMAHG